MDKTKKKELLNQYKNQQKEGFIKSLPISVETFKKLFDYLDEADEECEGNLNRTIRFLEENNCPVEKVVEWFYKNGGGCDCEVLANVEEKFVVMKIIPEPEYEDDEDYE